MLFAGGPAAYKINSPLPLQPMINGSGQAMSSQMASLMPAHNPQPRHSWGADQYWETRELAAFPSSFGEKRDIYSELILYRPVGGHTRPDNTFLLELQKHFSSTHEEKEKKNRLR